MVIKINKQKLIMEEVEQFESITLEDLAEGALPSVFWLCADASNISPQNYQKILLDTCFYRTSSIIKMVANRFLWCSSTGHLRRVKRDSSHCTPALFLISRQRYETPSLH